MKPYGRILAGDESAEATSKRTAASPIAAGRPGRRNPHFHGSRSSNPMTVLWALAAVAVFAVVFVGLLTVQAHRGARTDPAAPAGVSSTVVPAPPTTPQHLTCFPFQPC